MLLILALVAVAVYFAPALSQKADITPPATMPNRSAEPAAVEKPCSNEHPEWRQAQVIDGVTINEAPSCEPDNPYDIAVAVKGTNNVSMQTLMQTH
ncbi:MAG: multicopper oxidase domain-containing protein, partial [Methylobacter sp.]